MEEAEEGRRAERGEHRDGGQPATAHRPAARLAPLPAELGGVDVRGDCHEDPGS